MINIRHNFEVRMLPTYFESEISQDGYDWIEASEPKLSAEPRRSGKYLTDDWGPQLERIRYRRYKPLEEFSGLFRIFGDTEPDPAGVKAFANRFGLLLGPQAPLIGLRHRPSGSGHLLDRGEPLSAWRDPIQAVRLAVELWDAARRGDLEMLGEHIAWNEQGVTFFSHPELKEKKRPKERSSVSAIASLNHRRELFDTMTRGDLIKPALTVVQRTVNENLAKWASPQLLWSDERSDLTMRLVPKNLLGAIWLQFAGAIERDNEFRKCAECGTWFELTPQTARSDKIYCSNACRTKAYRGRQVEATRLHDEGHSATAIAETLNADIEAVNGWLKRSGRRPSKGSGHRK